MPKAEVGSTKHLANQMKAKGLQRLRWYCQICGKQCRDENGFKQHTQSEGHVRAMLLVGEDPKKYIREYSRQFQGDFLRLLKTSHGEKAVHMNQFYQEYIRDKEHVHMNATQWPSLTEFAKHLGREGLCRVEEGERGLEIAFVDDSPEAVRRRAEVRKMEGRAKGEEEWEARMLGEQIRRAREQEREKEEKERQNGGEREDDAEKKVQLGTAEPVKMSLSLKGKTTAPTTKTQAEGGGEEEEGKAVSITSLSTKRDADGDAVREAESADKDAASPKPAAPPAKLSLSFAAKAKPANLLAQKNPFAKKRDAVAPAPEKKMSNAERIMKEEMERKRLGDQRGQGGGKRQRLG